MLVVSYFYTSGVYAATETGTLTDPTPGLTVFEANSFLGYNHALGSYQDATVPVGLR